MNLFFAHITRAKLWLLKDLLSLMRLSRWSASSMPANYNIACGDCAIGYLTCWDNIILAPRSKCSYHLVPEETC